MTLIRESGDRKLLERRMHALYADSSRLQERAELLGRGGAGHAREAAEANAQARAAEAEANALFWALDMLKVTQKRAVDAERRLEREIARLTRDIGRERQGLDRERKHLDARVRDAEARAQAMADALRDAEGGFPLDRLVREAAERLPAETADRETVAIYGALFDMADEDGIVAVSLAELRHATRLAEPRIRRTLVRLAAADAIETAGPTDRERSGAAGRPCFRLIDRTRETRRAG